MKMLALLYLCFTPLLWATEVTFSGRLSDWKEVSLSKDVASFILNIEYQGSEKVIIADLIDPQGKSWIKSNIGAPSESRVPIEVDSAFRSLIRSNYSSAGLGAVLVSNSTRENHIETGLWKYRLGTTSKSNEMKIVDVHVLSKASHSNEKVLSMNFDLFYDPIFTKRHQLASILEDVKAVYRKGLINVSFNLIEKTFSQKAITESLDTVVDQLQMGRRANPSISLIAHHGESVKDFQGFAGCLPGFIPQKIDKHCALAIRYHDKEQVDLKKFSKVVAHEMGHFFGLFHLEDDYYPFGKLRDPIDDTDMSNEELNVMHKTSDRFGDIEFTPGQFEVMRRHPLLH
ncbi:MAG: hypothetical protein COW00_16300 [Bdellovibrio sp. CG12_big_fil_rev_8_21_14_0_65_39_13]|nr:MAG: hypothetical protein COW78_02680 [Bdellovibrio sp. CG22_combo_CG10-13_8_21_14_all_39_27]PIQ58403.1 MAG: hypothetical protein COW00_16300 [Bdellovibrio sp. CG12_big_fil_rev_8_21_14_0_65_39_13]PIR35916.1 MAG: hypothetical protein COV37_06885 [Bdellovibrio sp. CG11_big_fil_rev_8_21_14_0_20_39_38]